MYKRQLIRLAGDVRRFGTLDNFSAFPFENALKRIKKLVRKPNLPLQQLTNRLFEKQQFGKTETLAFRDMNAAVFKKEHFLGPVPCDLVNVPVKQYEQLYYRCDGRPIQCLKPANKVEPIFDQRPSSGLQCGKDPYSNCDGRATRCTSFTTTKLLHAVRRHIGLLAGRLLPLSTPLPAISIQYTCRIGLVLQWSSFLVHLRAVNAYD